VITFLIIFGMLAWGLITLLLGLAGSALFCDANDGWEACGALLLVLLALGSAAGIFTVISANGWFDDTPQAGCYRVITDYDDGTSWVPITCPPR